MSGQIDPRIIREIFDESRRNKEPMHVTYERITDIVTNSIFRMAEICSKLELTETKECKSHARRIRLELREGKSSWSPAVNDFYRSYKG